MWIGLGGVGATETENPRQEKRKPRGSKRHGFTVRAKAAAVNA